MNRIFKVIWNQATQSWVAVSELQKAKGKTASKTDKRVAAVFLATAAAITGSAYAATAITGTVRSNGQPVYIETLADRVLIGQGSVDNAANGVEATQTVVIGVNADSGSSAGAVAIGHNAKGDKTGASNTRHRNYLNPYNTLTSVAGVTSVENGRLVGKSGQIVLSSTVSIGRDASSDGAGVAVGDGASAMTGDQGYALGVAVGSNAQSRDGGIAIGSSVLASGLNSMAFGRQAAAVGNASQAIGSSSAAVGNGATAIGHSATALGNRSMAFGASTSSTLYDAASAVIANADDSIAIGTKSQTGSGANSSFAIGHSANVTGKQAGALGFEANASGLGSMAMGKNANASNNSSNAMGEFANSSGVNAFAMGTRANASGESAYAIGTDTVANNTKSIAIGSEAKSTEDKTIAIGDRANATGYHGISIGAAATASGNTSMALGDQAVASSNYSFAAGGLANATGQYATALGANANATNNSAIAVGKSATASGSTSAALGVESNASGTDGLALGRKASATNTSAVAIGNNSTASATNTLAIGRDASVAAATATAFGMNATVELGAVNAMVFGLNATAKAVAQNSIVMGRDANASAQQAIVIGQNSSVSAGTSNAIGLNNTVASRYATVFGQNNNLATTANNTFVLGSGVSTNVTRSVLLGSGTTATSANHKTYTTTTEGQNTVVSLATQVNDATVNSVSYSGFAGAGGKAKGIVSVGNENETRQILNVAPGEISSSSTDAINGSQLYSAITNGHWKLQAGGNNVGEINWGDKVNFTSDGSITITPTNESDGVSTLNLSIPTTTLTQNNDSMSFGATSGDGDKFVKASALASHLNSVGFRLTGEANGGEFVDSASDKKITTGEQFSLTAKNGIKITQQDNGYGIEVNTASVGSSGNKATVPTGKGNTVATVQSIADAINNSGFTLKTSANGGENLGGSSEVINPGDVVDMAAGKNLTVKQESNGKITYATKDDVAFNSVSITNGPTINGEGINMNGDKITHVAPGTDDGDAVNVKQLKDAQTKVVKGTNIVDVTSETDDATGATTYTVNAKGSTVSKGSDKLTLKQTEKDGNITDFELDLSQTAKESLDKADTAMQSLTTSVNGGQVEVLNQTNKDIGFVNGAGTTARASGQDITFDVNKGNLTTDKGNVTSTVTGDSFVTGDNVANAINNAVASAKEKVEAGTNIVSVETKVDDVTGATTYTVNAKGTTATHAAGSAEFLTVSDAQPKDSNISNYEVALTDRAKTALTAAESAVQQFTTAVKGATVDTINKDNTVVNFVDGSGTVATNKDGDITFDVNVDNDTIKVGSDGKLAVNKDAVDTNDITRLVAGNNVEITPVVNGNTTTYTVNAKDTTVSNGSDKVTITKSDKGNNVTDFAVDLSAGAKESLNKADTAVQSFTTSVNGTAVETINQTNNDVNFVNGTGTTARNTDGNITFDVNKGGLTTDAAGNVTSNTAGDNFVTGDDVAKAINEAAERTEKTTTVVKGSNTHVQSNVTGNNTEYTVSADKATVTTAAALKKTETTTTDATTQAVTTNYEIDLSDATKEQIAKEESVSTEDANLSVDQDTLNGTKGKNFKVSLKKQLDLGDAGSVTMGDTVINNDGITVGGNTLTNTPMTVNGNTVTNVNEAINQTAAQAFSPLTFAGDSGANVERKLGTTLNVTGGVTDPSALSSGNIGVVANGTDGLAIKLAKALTDINSIVVNNGPTINGDGIDMKGDTITNVGDGVNPNDAVNVKQLNASKEEVTSNDKSITVDTSRKNASGAQVFDVSVNTDETTITKGQDGKVTAVTSPLTNNNTDGSVNTPAKPDALVTAQSVADAINNAGFKVKSAGNKAADDEAGSKLITVGDEVLFAAGDNLTVKRVGNQFTFATAKEVVFDKVTVGPVTIDKTNGIDAGNTQITNVAPGEAPTDAVNVSQLTNATAASKTEVTGSGLANVTKKPTPGANGQDIYNVDVAIAETPTVTPGNVKVKEGDEGKVMTAGDVAKAITGAEKTSSVKAGSASVTVTSAAEDAQGNTEYTVDLSEETKKQIAKEESVTAGNTNLTVEQDTTNDTGGKNYKVTLNNNLDLTDGGSVKAGDTTLNKDGLKVGNNTLTNAVMSVDGNTITNVNEAINKTAEQAFSPLTFAGDSGANVARRLGTTLNVKGGVTDTTKLSDSNIGVVANGTDGLDIKLAKDLKDIDSITVNDGPTINGDGINMNGDKITGLKAGEQDTDAVNVSQLKAKVAESKWTLKTAQDGAASTVGDINPDDKVTINGKGVVKVTNDAEADGESTVHIAVETQAMKVENGKAEMDGNSATGGTQNAAPNRNALSTVGDVIDVVNNISWSIHQNNGAAVNQVKAGNAVHFVDSDQLTANVTKEGDGKTNVTFTAKTVELTDANKDGVVDTPTSAEDKQKLVTAENVAKAINAAGWKAKSGGNKAEGDEEDSTLINPGEEVEFNAGDNLKVKRQGNVFTFETAKDVKFNSVTSNTITVPTDTANPTNNPITMSKDGISAGNKSISNVASNLADASTANEQPEANKPADLANKLNNAATVGDLLNAGWNLQGNGTAVDTVTHNDTVNFINGKGTTVTVEKDADGKNTIKVDSAVEFVNNNTADTSTPSTTAKLTGNTPVQLGNVASGVRKADGTTPAGKARAEAINKAEGNTLNNAVNVGDLQAATQAAKTEVKGSGLATVAEPTIGENGQTIYTVEVAKADAPTIEDGKVNAGDTNNQNKVMVAGDVAKAINESGWNLAAEDTDGKELINPSNTVTFKTGSGNLTVKRDGANIIYDLAKDIKVDSVTAGNTTVNNDGITIKNSDPNKTVSLTDKGLNNGGNQIKNVAEGTEGTDAVNVNQLNRAVAASQEDVVSNDGSITVQREVNPVTKATTFDISVNVDNTTITKDKDGQLTANTVALSNDDSGKVKSPKLGDNNLGKSLVTAQTVVDAINNAGFIAQASASAGEVSGEQAQRIKIGETVTFDAGKNIKITQTAGTFSFATKEDVSFNRVTSNTITVPTDTANPANNPITISKDGISAGNKSISNVASNLADASTANEQPEANKPADLANKLNNAATVGDLLNAGWNLQGNGTAVDTVTHNDTVNFINGKGTTVTVKKEADGKNTIKVDSAVEFVNNNSADTSTPSTTAKLTGNTPVQLGNVASGVRKAEGTTPAGKARAEAINKAEGDTLNNAVNVGDLQAATQAATTKVDGDQGVTVTPTTNADGSTTYNVAAKTDGTTIKVENGNITANTSELGNNSDGTVKTPTQPAALVTAQTVADAINHAGFNLQANGDTASLVKAGNTVQFLNGRNIEITRNGHDITVATAKDVNFNRVQFNQNGPTITNEGDNLKVGDKDGNATKITNVADGDISPVSNEVINGKQLNQYTKVNGNHIGTDASGAINIVNGTGTTITSGAAGEVKVNVNTTGLEASNGTQANADGSIAPEGSLVVQDPNGSGASYVNATTLATAVNNVSWKVDSAKDDTTANAATRNTYTAGNNKVKAGETVKVNAGRNIEISGSGKTLNVAVSDNPEFNTVKVGKGANATTISSNEAGLSVAKADGSAQRITNVAAGQADNDAVNVGQLKGAVNHLNNKLHRNNREARAGIAGSNAAASLPQVYIPGKSMVAAAGGTFKGENALAVGYSRSSDNGKLILKLQGNANSRGDFGGGVGVGYQW